MPRRIGSSTAFSTIAVLLLFHIAIAEPTQRVPFETCRLGTDTTQCFTVSSATIHTVDRKVAALGGSSRLCLSTDTITTGVGRIRVMLMIDASGSMCNAKKPGDCCVAGDGSGNCENNDPDNQRIVAAHQFVEELRSQNPASEVGVVVYADNVEQTLAPLALSSSDNLDQIHSTINQAACGGSNCGAPCTAPTYGLQKSLRSQEQAGAAKLSATHPGAALERALELIDREYDSAPEVGRHIILLTDGAWDDGASAGPSQVIADYTSANPGRAVPRVHGVFLSDMETHLAHGYPAAGCSGSNQVYLDSLEKISQLTSGLYYPGETPQTIVDKFLAILDEISVSRNEALLGVTYRRLPDGTAQKGTITGSSAQNSYIVAVPDIPLNIGDNAIQIRQRVRTVEGTEEIRTDTLHINRAAANTGEAPGTPFAVACAIDTTDLGVRCSPAEVEVEEPVTATARVSTADASAFMPGNVTVRAFVPFPEDANGMVALYHLDGALTDQVSGSAADGQVQYATTDAAFTSCISSGSFTANLGGVGSDFTVESWVRIGFGSPKSSLISGTGFELGIDAQHKLYATIGTQTVVSTLALPADVWCHVAVARSSGTARLYVNGLAVADGVSAGGTLPATATVAVPGGGMIDEVRISNLSRTYNHMEGLDIPTHNTITWTMRSTSTGAAATLPSTLWPEEPLGEANFAFTSPRPAEVIVNLLHDHATTPWSVNANPVRIISGAEAISVVATLQDTSANGYLDRIVIRWPDTLTLSDTLPTVQALVDQLSLVLHSGSTVELTASSVSILSDTTLAIVLEENEGELETGWQGDATVRLTAVPLTTTNQPFEVQRADDGAGPVVAEARLSSSGLTDNDALAVDTLTISFSEPLVWRDTSSLKPADVLEFLDSGAVSSEAFAGLDQDDIKVLDDGSGVVVTMSNGFVVEPREDQIRLKGSTELVSDGAENAPPDNAQPRTILWGAGSQIRVVAAPLAELRRGSQAGLYEKTIAYYSTVLPPNAGSRPLGGTVVSVETVKPLKNRGTDVDGRTFYGSAVVFDALGNVVADNLKVKEIGNRRKYAAYWDGRNHNGRKVGPGTYLVVATVTDINNKTITNRTKIGIKHKIK